MSEARRMLKTISLLAGVTLGFAAVAQDQPDQKKENQLHRIYKNLNENPTSEEKWSAAVGAAQGQNYQIQKGDTLWGVSETYFGEADFWPKIWSLNQDSIFNPHEITTGDEIRFIPGTVDEPPRVEVVKQGSPAATAPETSAETPAAQPPDKSGNAEPPEPPSRFSKYNLAPTEPTLDVDLTGVGLPKSPASRRNHRASALPESLPPWSMRGLDERLARIEALPVKRTAPANEINVTSWIQDREPAYSGEIVEAEAGMTAAHENQYVVVKLAAAQSGQKFLVYSHLGELTSATTGENGVILEAQGEILVQESVNQEEGLYRALVVRAFEPILVGSKIGPGEILRVPLEGVGEPTELGAQIVGGAHEKVRKMFGPGEILFMDVGSKASATVGQTLPIYRNEGARAKGSLQVSNSRRIGAVRIVKVSDHFATALVVSAIEELQVGDSASRKAQ